MLKKINLADLKSDLDKLDIDKLKNISTNFSNMKSRVDNLHFDKLVLVLVDLSKLSDAVKNFVVKKDVYNSKIKKIDDKIPGIVNLVSNGSADSKINGVKNKIPNITNLATTTALLLLL